MTTITRVGRALVATALGLPPRGAQPGPGKTAEAMSALKKIASRAGRAAAVAAVTLGLSVGLAAAPASAAPTGPDRNIAAAPTANLRKLADAIVVQNKGLYLRITAPAGLNVGPIEMSFGFGGQRYTRNYDNAGTNDLLSFPPLDGAARREYWDITLTERIPGRPYHAFGSQIDVVPLYTVTTSNLYFATGGCDPLGGEADPTIVWVDPAGVQHRIDEGGISGFGDEVTAHQFIGRWTGVDVNTGLTAPRIEWVDRDPFGYRFPRNYAVPRGARLLPFPVSYPTRDPVVHEVEQSLRDRGGDCTGLMRYFVTWAPEPPAI